ncbi:MAG TPA: hypothetical protein PLT82_07755 [Candidatus Hydrogenedens sp.]|mgnify:CR=1 FL=1|nr:hypothetical protein [Candidatus Hydrogenedens sp.]HOK09471.1 hypothetical protein [Candidatus Hydrogenedens sp.]HOL18938.1 hypothetical protein [Candidatus Hydrogenedens sp.]HPP59010.1 hypothetical protein [Candidatus Hydrogenedens sp.]
MLGFLLIMKAEIIRGWIITRRYWFRTLTGLIIGYGMLMILIAGFFYSQPAIEKGINQFEDPTRATNYILGFIIGLFAFGVIGMFTQGIQGMAQTGILEQLCMSPYGLVTNFLARAVVASVSTIFYSALMVYMVVVSVGGKLHFDPIPVVVLLTLSFINLLGFGFLVGGLVLVFKQVGQLTILVRMALFALAIFAREEFLQQGWLISAFMHALPITDASICLKYVLVKGQLTNSGQFVSVFLHPSFYWLGASCVFWTFIGITLFKIMENYSRYKGTLGIY